MHQGVDIGDEVVVVALDHEVVDGDFARLVRDRGDRFLGPVLAQQVIPDSQFVRVKRRSISQSDENQAKILLWSTSRLQSLNVDLQLIVQSDGGVTSESSNTTATAPRDRVTV